jgi:hypothetical protein
VYMKWSKFLNTVASMPSILMGGLEPLPLPPPFILPHSLNLLTSSPWMPQSSLSFGEPQSESTDGGEVLAGAGGMGEHARAPRSTKLWLRFTNDWGFGMPSALQ